MRTLYLHPASSPQSPCPEACSHSECAEATNLKHRPCCYCTAPLVEGLVGFGIPVNTSDEPDHLAPMHASCHLRACEALDASALSSVRLLTNRKLLVSPYDPVALAPRDLTLSTPGWDGPKPTCWSLDEGRMAFRLTLTLAPGRTTRALVTLPLTHTPPAGARVLRAVAGGHYEVCDVVGVCPLPTLLTTPSGHTFTLAPTDLVLACPTPWPTNAKYVGHVQAIGALPETLTPGVQVPLQPVRASHELTLHQTELKPAEPRTLGACHVGQTVLFYDDDVSEGSDAPCLMVARVTRHNTAPAQPERTGMVLAEARDLIARTREVSCPCCQGQKEVQNPEWARWNEAREQALAAWKAEQPPPAENDDAAMLAETSWITRYELLHEEPRDVQPCEACEGAGTRASQALGELIARLPALFEGFADLAEVLERSL